MTKIAAIAINDLRVFFADRGNLIGIFVIPVVFSVVMGVAFGSGGSAERLRVDVIDLDNSALSAQFLDEIHAVNDTLRLCPMDNDEDNSCSLEKLEEGEGYLPLTTESGIERLQNTTTASLIVIPQGYGDQLGAFQNVNVEYYSLTNAVAGDAVLQAIQAASRQINGAVVASRVGVGIGDVLASDGGSIFADDAARDNFSQAVYTRASEMLAQTPSPVRYVLTEEGEQSSSNSSSGFNQSVPGMGTMFVMFNVLTGMMLLIKERRLWTLQRLVVTPISRGQLLAGKILARFLMGVSTFVLLVLVGLLIGVDFGSNPVAIALIIISYTLCVTAMTFAIAPLLRTENQAAGVINLMGLSMAALGGAWWPLDIVPNVMKVIGHFSPVAWAMDGFNEILYYGGGVVDVLGYVGVLLAISAVLFLIGIINFEYE